jgi:hypothetical protein
MLENFFHTVSVGIDAKHFEQTVTQPGSPIGTPGSFASPVTYYPIVATYTATMNGQGTQTVLNAGVTAGLRASAACRLNSTTSVSAQRRAFSTCAAT